MKIYNLRTFDTETPNNTERYLYYNPECDIVYFGEETCISNIVNLLTSTRRGEGLAIPRVAIQVDSKKHQCCDYDDDAYGVNDHISFMQALHGVFPPLVRETDTMKWTQCCAGLKEVFWVVPSAIFPVRQGGIDATVSMRPATTNALTKDQRWCKKDTLWAVKMVEDGKFCSGVNLWAVDKLKFSFVSFAPRKSSFSLNLDTKRALSLKNDLFTNRRFQMCVSITTLPARR